MFAATTAKIIRQHLAENGVPATVETDSDQTVNVLLRDACPATVRAVCEWKDQYPRAYVMTTYNPEIRAAATKYQQAHPGELMHDILTAPGPFWTARKERVRTAA